MVSDAIGGDVVAVGAGLDMEFSGVAAAGSKVVAGRDSGVDTSAEGNGSGSVELGGERSVGSNPDGAVAGSADSVGAGHGDSTCGLVESAEAH